MKYVLGLFTPGKMQLSLIVLFVTSLGLFTIGCRNAPEETTVPDISSIEGVWVMTNYGITNADTSFSYLPQPSLTIYTKKHYSHAAVNGYKPRPLIPEGKNRITMSDADRIAILVPYTSNSGTYEIVGDSIIRTPSVALTPDLMEGGNESFHFSVTGDSVLVLTDETGIATMTFKKVE